MQDIDCAPMLETTRLSLVALLAAAEVISVAQTLAPWSVAFCNKSRRRRARGRTKMQGDGPRRRRSPEIKRYVAAFRECSWLASSLSARRDPQLRQGHRG